MRYNRDMGKSKDWYSITLMYSHEVFEGNLRVQFSESEYLGGVHVHFRHDRLSVLISIHSIIHNIFVEHVQ